jgi:type I restriction enzyme, R subunit
MPPEDLLVKSENFEFLRPRHPELADLAGFAESYARTDPSSALVKLRTFTEYLVEGLFVAWKLPRPLNANLNDLLNESAFCAAVPQVVRLKLHLLRRRGNDAAHGMAVGPQLALVQLREAFDVASWVFLGVDGGQRAQLPVYREPVAAKGSDGADPVLQKEKKAALDRLAAQEAQLQKLLADLDARNQALAVAEQAAAASREALEAILAAGQKAANTLQLDELATRRRIVDDDLLAAGWNVGANGVSTEQVGQEVKVKGMPTASGDGVADYVLWGDDGKPLAVIEAKRALKSAREGQTQAALYADCLEKKHGQRPVVFFTNGYDVHLWDDAQKYPPRKIHGYYSKDSLEYLIFQRAGKAPLATVAPALSIADRLYQIEAVKRVCERFGDRHRKALLVQATGTGKTRVAASLCDVLMRASWAKRILFLCDRRELLRQADRVFKEHLPGEPRVTVKRETAKDRDKRIYLATYPAMAECFRSFDVGFFDLVIADESHRSIYNKHRELFLYFDALQVGLTATPVKFVERNTYRLFGCEDKVPTSAFGFDEAIASKPPYLVPFRVVTHTTRFLREGVKYSQMSDAQRAQLENDEDHPELVEYDAEQVDRQIFNRDTTREILRNLMEGGIREGTGSRVGKTIVFARSHKHAEHIADVFEKTYPRFGGSFLRIIDNQEPRAEQLIDDFKDRAKEPTIAVSVDMLDTGIDVPEVVNLVFAKPIRSYVKFWQMIGRGTRLCRDLFGPGRHKTEFLIFDHWGNFPFFEEEHEEKDPAPPRSLLQQLFEARMALAEAALDAMAEPVFQATVDLLLADLRDARASDSIEVRDRAGELDKLAQRETLATFAASTKADLLQIAAPLMQWRDVRGDEDAYRFDLLVTQLEVEVLRKSARVADLRARVEEQVELLMKNQSPVKAKADTILAVRTREFWAIVDVPRLEDVRTELRGVMKYQQQVKVPRVGPVTIDVEDGGVEQGSFVPAIEGLALVEYRQHVESALALHFKENTTLYKIREGKPVHEDELEELCRLVLQVDDKADLKQLAAHQPETQKSRLYTLRGLVGLDPVAVDAAFTAFVHRHPRLSAQQIRFLQLLKHHIARNGGIEIERLYQDPFTTLHAGGIDGVFTDPGQVDEIVTLLAAFTPPSSPESKRAS